MSSSIPPVEPDHNAFKPDLSSLMGGKSAMSYALTGLASRKRSASPDSWSSSSPAISDTESSEPTLLTPVGAAKGGDDQSQSAPHPTSSRKWTPKPGKGPVEDNRGGRDGRRKSIQVTIEKTGKHGFYTLTADDPEFREILQSGIEREAARMSGKSRMRFRDLAFTRQFTTFDRQNPLCSQSPFYGFFTLFWLAMALLLCKIAAQNYRNTGSVLGRAEILHLMFDRDLVALGITDGAMAVTTAFGFVLQKAIAKRYLSWSRSGWLIQSIWELIYTMSFLSIGFYRDWPWTHKVFIFLHVFVLLMKQHSYSFYNGYLSQVLRRELLLEDKLEKLEDMDVIESPESPTQGRGSFASGHEHTGHGSVNKRFSYGPKISTDLKKEQSEIALMAKVIESNEPLDEPQMHAFRRVLVNEISALDAELQGKSDNPACHYPANLTLTNFLDWTALPTLVYELEYPRLERINWWYVAEKSAATLGVIWIMIVVSQAFIYPVVVDAVSRKELNNMPMEERWIEFSWLVFDMLFPLLLEQLLAWYVIWECLLNVLAEVTRFADRGFYGDWWNSVSYDQYARNWNRPVHNFLLRHVYHSSISALHLSKSSAMFITFLVSAIVHEGLMFCLFKKVRGYLFLFQLSQIPLAALARTRFFKGKDMLGNVSFWLGLFIGPSLITGLYLIM